jgi:hypothetical protein
MGRFCIQHSAFIIREFNLEVQRRPEGSTINSHAREGVEHRKRGVPRSETTGSLLTVITHCRTFGAFALLRRCPRPRVRGY